MPKDEQTPAEEDKYASLSKYHTVFLIDDSNSMTGRSWHETKRVLLEIFPIIFTHDSKGPDIYFMNHKSFDKGNPDEPWKAGSGYRNVVEFKAPTSSYERRSIDELFKMTTPHDSTPTAERLGDILRPYMRWYERQVAATDDEACLKPLNIIVITDGEPSDDVGSIVVQTARRLDAIQAPPWQLGIQFFQVGNVSGAAESLRELDDDICKNSGSRDIVDTTTLDDDGNLCKDTILKVVLGAVDRRLDKKNKRIYP